MISRNNLFHRLLFRNVERETVDARERWESSPCPINWEADPMPKVWGMNVLVEEIGKLSRCINKLAISEDPNVKELWSKEGQHRIVTSMSMLRRMAESWDNLPDRPQLDQGGKDAEPRETSERPSIETAED